MTDREYMLLALQEAQLAALAGEVPVGAVVVYQDRVIAIGNNFVVRGTDPTAHAEVVALRTAAASLGNFRLVGCTVYSTLEPCAMCCGAMIHARIDRLVYGASDPKAGAAGSVMNVLNHPSLNHQMEVTPGVLAENCGEVLRAFFRERRS
ncbi:MAG TPA: tRNA adenosine(34) deaminase TadA [Acidisarcina sp.]